MKETSKFPFPTRRVQGRRKEHSDGINTKLQKIHLLLFLINKLSVLFCHYTCVCDISEHTSTKRILM